MTAPKKLRAASPSPALRRAGKICVMGKSADQIAEAAERCFAFAIKNEPAIMAAADFLALLKGGRDWTDSDIEAVRRLVLDKLRRQT
jgi:hypothetical protein